MEKKITKESVKTGGKRTKRQTEKKEKKNKKNKTKILVCVPFVAVPNNAYVEENKRKNSKEI